MNHRAKLYVMVEQGGLVKVGFSKNPRRRMKEPDIRRRWRNVQLVHETSAQDDALEIERLAHRILVLSAKNIQGEWFSATVEQAISAICLAIDQWNGRQLKLGAPVRRVMTETIVLMLSKSELETLESLRRVEKDIPTRSEMIRRLIERASDKKGRK